MISVRGLKKSFGDQILYDGADLQLNAGDRYALVGPNGAGKTTLFKMILGEEEIEGGSIEWKRGAKAGYLPQENAPIGPETVLETALAHRNDPDGRETAKAKKILMGLGFQVKDFDRHLSELSGGWAMRAALARLLVEEPELLLLDEPTNHLDLLTLVWFQKYLQSYPGAILMISHDRSFIDNVCSAIMAVEERKLKKYNTNYDGFLAEREAARERLLSAWKQQQDEIDAMKEFIMRNRARVSTASRVQSVMKKLDKVVEIVLPPSTKAVSISFPQPGRTGTTVLKLKNVFKSYGPTKVYEGLDFELERGWKMAFVGPNGAGKSTLLKVIGDIIPIDSGERILGHNVKVGYFSQHREGQLDPRRTVLQEAMSVGRTNGDLFTRTVLGTFLFPGDTVHKKVDVLSGGEKSRLQLAKLLLDPPNVLLLDEPTTHLDLTSVEALVGRSRSSTAPSARSATTSISSTPSPTMSSMSWRGRSPCSPETSSTFSTARPSLTPRRRRTSRSRPPPKRPRLRPRISTRRPRKRAAARRRSRRLRPNSSAFMPSSSASPTTCPTRSSTRTSRA